MKQKSIEESIQKTIISAITTVSIRVLVILGGSYLLYQKEVGLLLSVILWSVVGISAVTILFMPYLTWVRINELKEGEIYEAGKY